VLVVLDACVLYPASLRDLLLTLSGFDAFDVAWSEEILEEVRRNVVADHPDIDPDRFTSHTLGAMRSAFPEASVTGYEETTATLDNDPKDRHVAAAAIVARADAIVTVNVADFRGATLDAAGIKVQTPGEFIERLLDDEPAIVVAAIDHLSRRWTRPALTASQVLDLLARQPTMSRAVQRLRDLMD
jgi:predicted nucleic acid-binding protein